MTVLLNYLNKKKKIVYYGYTGMDNMKPGDLIFYARGSTINHVAIYIGNGRVVHASNKREGIKTSAIRYRTPVKAVRFIQDQVFTESSLCDMIFKYEFADTQSMDTPTDSQCQVYRKEKEIVT